MCSTEQASVLGYYLCQCARHVLWLTSLTLSTKWCIRCHWLSCFVSTVLGPGLQNWSKPDCKHTLLPWCLPDLSQDAINEYKLATDSSMAKETGKYYVGGRESRPPRAAQDLNTRRRLWKIMTEHTGATYWDQLTNTDQPTDKLQLGASLVFIWPTMLCICTSKVSDRRTMPISCSMQACSCDPADADSRRQSCPCLA